MESGNYPRSIGEIGPWSRRHGATVTEARRRFAQFAVLEAVALAPPLSTLLVFKGGNALRFIYANRRGTVDLDFTAGPDFPDDPNAMRKSLDASLKAMERRYLFKARCQTIKRKPPGMGKTMPTYFVTICYQLPGDKYYQNFAEPRSYHEVVELEISLNDVVCDVDEHVLAEDTQPIKVCTLEDIIAEKLRALLQQIPRKRSRPQDVYDIAAMTRVHGTQIDLNKVALFLVRKAKARGY